MRLDKLSNHPRNYVSRLDIEVVAGSVEVDGEEANRIHTVLVSVRLRLHQEHLLRQAVGRIGFFRIAVPQIIFAEWDRRELWIGAHRSSDDHLRHFSNATCL